MLEVRNLTKRYGDNIAIEGLSFTVEENRIYGFLGPNGAGKSTTMNIITGYLAPTEGQVLIDGEDMLKNPVKAKAGIGYLPEIPPVYPDMTVEEYLLFAAELKKLPKSSRKEAVNGILEKAHIMDVRGRLIRNLSKGYRQRTGLAQALIGAPKLIILDEPTVGLDPLQIIEIRGLIKELGKEHTVILSSHILQEISAVCDHIMVISKGHLVASDTPEGLARGVEKETTTYLKLRAKAEEAERRLGQIEAITSAEVTASEEEGLIDVTLKSPDDRDIREELFKTMSEAGLPILEMHTARMTLEDVYLKLTGDEAVQEPGSSGSQDDASESEESRETAGDKTIDKEEPGKGAPDKEASDKEADDGKVPDKEASDGETKEVDS